MRRFDHHRSLGSLYNDVLSRHLQPVPHSNALRHQLHRSLWLTQIAHTCCHNVRMYSIGQAVCMVHLMTAFALVKLNCKSNQMAYANPILPTGDLGKVTIMDSQLVCAHQNTLKCYVGWYSLLCPICSWLERQVKYIHVPYHQQVLAKCLTLWVTYIIILELFRAHTPRPYCTIYMELFLRAWQ